MDRKVKEKIFVPINEKVTLTIEEAAAYSNLGLNKIRELAKNPKYNIGLFVGRKILIKRKELDRFLSERNYI